MKPPEKGATDDELSILNHNQLTKDIAELIIFSLGAPTNDPKATIMRFLQSYLVDAYEQRDNDPLAQLAMGETRSTKLFI